VPPNPLRFLRRRLRQAAERAAGRGRYLSDYLAFYRMSRRVGRDLPLRWRDRYPCLHDRTRVVSFEPHYTFHTAWAARVIAELAPERHVDVASSLLFAVPPSCPSTTTTTGRSRSRSPA
jgi:hypothetical protein